MVRYVVQRGQRRDAGQVLLGGAEPGFVAPHQDVRAAVDQDDRVDAVEVDQRAVGGAQRLHADLGEGVHGGRVAVRLQPPGQGPLGEVGLVGCGARGDGGDVGGGPLVDGQPGEGAEGEVRQVDLLALVQEGEGEGEAGVDVEAAARAGDQDALGFGEAGEERVGVQGRHGDHCAGRGRTGARDFTVVRWQTTCAARRVRPA